MLPIDVDENQGHAWSLMNAPGVVGEEIDIKPAALQMLGDMDHLFAKDEPVPAAFRYKAAGAAGDAGR